MTPTVHIALSVHNGARYLAEQVRSLQAQSHDAWILWVRDDGSTDETPAVLRTLATEDGRIRVHPRDGQRLNIPLCQEWLLPRLPGDADYVLLCDADDVWLPRKIERSLAAMSAAEADGAGPILVHTDLEVVDRDLSPIAPSFWAFTATPPEPTDLARLLVANVATGPTVLMNRALLDIVLPVPADAAVVDWWVALVASVFGRIVAVPEATVLYRRHGANDSRPLAGGPLGLGDGLRRIAGARARTGDVRSWIDGTARQASAFLERFRAHLGPEEVACLESLASIRGRGPLGRKLAVWRHHALPERGVLRNLGLVLRA